MGGREGWPGQDLAVDLVESAVREGSEQVVGLGVTDMERLCRSQVRCGLRRRLV